MSPSAVGPYVELPRRAWAELAASTPAPLAREVLDQVRGLGDPTDQSDVAEVYHPLTELITRFARGVDRVWGEWDTYLRLDVPTPPFVLGVTGSVAVGKTTVSRLLAELLRRSCGHPTVALVTTDSFLLPNAVLEQRGLADRKGFPQTYDTDALLRFVIAVKSGTPEVACPVYSHVSYDIVPGQVTRIVRPDILVLEGLNVLQPPPSSAGLSMSVADFVDFSVYVDADEDAIERWFIERFLALRGSAFADPGSFFRQYAVLGDDEAIAVAHGVWRDINGPNLRENIVPTRGRASVVLRKDADHVVETVRIRRV